MSTRVTKAEQPQPPTSPSPPASSPPASSSSPVSSSSSSPSPPPACCSTGCWSRTRGRVVAAVTHVRHMPPHQQATLAFTVLLALALPAVIVTLTLTGVTVQGLDWLADQGAAGGVLIVALYLIIASPFPVPLGWAILTLSCGYLYGLGIGFCVCAGGNAAGAALCVALCRRWFRPWLLRTLASRPRAVAVLAVIQRHRDRAIVLCRLTPLPYGLKNGLVSVSEQSLARVVTMSSLGEAPAQVAFVYMGSRLDSVSALVEGGDGSDVQKALLLTQIVVVVLVIATIIFVARRELRRLVAETPEQTLLDVTEATVTPAATPSLPSQQQQQQQQQQATALINNAAAAVPTDATAATAAATPVAGVDTDGDDSAIVTVDVVYAS